jgi:hypothetical protein
MFCLFQANAEELVPGQTNIGNIVAGTFCFLSMFPSLLTPGNIVPGTKFASGKQKCFQVNLELFLLRKQ